VLGISVGYFFSVPELVYTVCGILVLVASNILDCVDGQLARLSGRKSPVGRILDGLAGDLWFLSIYIGLSLRLYYTYATYWFFAAAAASGLSHLLQANITDYYKTLHLYFISREKGGEFQSAEQVRKRERSLPQGWQHIFYRAYFAYTRLQERFTPTLQAMLRHLHDLYGDDIPQNLREGFRTRSRKLMKLIDLLTFNGRTLPLFLFLLVGIPWAYFIYEGIFLNIILLIVIHKHERLCAKFMVK
jgi:hypothetical protein